MALNEDIAELRSLGMSDADIEAAIGFSFAESQTEQAQQQAPIQDDAALDAADLEELKALGATEDELLQAGISTAPTVEEQGQQIQAFQQQQQSAAQERQEAFAQVAAETTGPQAFGAAAGREIEKFGRVVRGVTGLATPEQLQEERTEEAERFAPLQEQRPVSTIAGSVAGAVGVGLLPGGLAGKVTAKVAGKLIGPRLAAISGAAAAGAVEESLVEGNPLLGAAFGAGGQVVLPIVGEGIKSVWKRALGTDVSVGGRLDANGRLTPSAVQELESAGFTLQGLGSEVEEILLRQLDPDSALEAQARQAEAAFFDSRLSGSRASRDAELQSLESLALANDADIAQQATAILSQNQRALAGGAERQILEPLSDSRTTFNIADLAATGNKQEVARLLREQLTRRKNLEVRGIEGLYKRAAKLPGANAPVDAARLTHALISNADSASNEMQEKVLQVLAKYKVVGDNVEDLGLGNFTVTIAGKKVPFRSKTGPQDLNIGNAEKLRQDINKLSPTSAADVALMQQLKDSLDIATVNAVSSLPVSSIKREAFETARKEAGRIKTAYETSDIIKDLLTFKDFNKTTPQISDDVLVERFMSKNTPTASLAKLKGLLNTSGRQGKQTWNEFRSVSMEDFLRKSMIRNAQNEPVLSFKKLDDQLKALGDSKLKIFFDAGERKVLSQLRTVLKNQDTPLTSLSSTAAGSGATGNAITRVLSAVTRIVTGSQVAGAAFDSGSSAIKHSSEAIRRKAILLDGLESIKGAKMTPRQKKISATAKTQRFLQDLFEFSESLARAPAAAATGTEAVESLTENTEELQNAN